MLRALYALNKIYECLTIDDHGVPHGHKYVKTPRPFTRPAPLARRVKLFKVH